MSGQGHVQRPNITYCYPWQIELEKERLALELEERRAEEQQRRAETEKRISEQQKKIDSLSHMVINSVVDDTQDKKSRKVGTKGDGYFLQKDRFSSSVFTSRYTLSNNT